MLSEGRRTGRRYVDESMERCYQAALELATDPTNEFYYNGDAHRGASHRCAFWDGYDGKTARQAMVRPGTMAWAFYQAGRVWAKRYVFLK